MDHCGVLGRRAQGSREDNKSLYSRCRFWLTTNTKKHPWVRAMVFAEKSDLATHQVGKLADAPVIHQRASQATHPADRSLVFRPVRPRVLEIFGAQQPHFARACEGSSLRKRTVWPRSMCWNRKWFVASALLVGLQLLSVTCGVICMAHHIKQSCFHPARYMTGRDRSSLTCTSTCTRHLSSTVAKVCVPLLHHFSRSRPQFFKHMHHWETWLKLKRCTLWILCQRLN